MHYEFKDITALLRGHLGFKQQKLNYPQLECGPISNVMAALPHIGGALCSTLQSLADAHY